MKMYYYLIPFFVSYVCGIQPTLDGQEFATKLQSNTKVRAYFSPDDAIIDIFVSYINHEQESIDIAIYTLTHRKIIQALVNASRRGVIVQVIIDEFSLITNKNNNLIDQLIEAGVNVYLFNPKIFFYGGSGNAQLFFNKLPSLSRYRNSKTRKNYRLPKEKHREFSIRPLMHHKFCIFGKNIDNQSIVWTGSFNFTFCATSRNQENVLVISNQEINQKFKQQFNIIKNERSQRLHSYRSTVNKDGICELLFTPDQTAMDRLIQLVDQEFECIKMAIYSLSNAQIIAALVRAHQRGVRVEIILDHSQKTDLMESGVSIYLFDKKRFNAGMADHKDLPDREYSQQNRIHAIMHNKFCVFKKNNKGKKLLWTGSLNFTYNSDLLFQNNALIIDDLSVVEQFEKQFELIKNKRCILFVATEKNAT